MHAVVDEGTPPGAAVADPRAGAGLGGWCVRLWHAPVSLTLALASLVMTVVEDWLTPSSPIRIGPVSHRPWLRLDPATVTPGRIGLELITPGTWTALLIVLIVVTIIGPTIEQRLGSLRYGLVLLACHLVGFLFVTALTWTIHPWWPDWAAAMREGWTCGVLPALLGALMTVSGGMSRLWCTRVRWTGLAMAVTLMLYDPSSTACLTCGAMLAGIVMSAVMWRGRRRTGVRPVRSERRVLVALIVACTGIGPLVAAWSAAVESPLAQLDGYVRTGSFEPPELRVICSLASHHACALARLHETAGFPTLLTTVLPSLILLVVCVGLLRGRRSAWLWALGVNTAMGATTVLLILTGMTGPAGPGEQADRTVLGLRVMTSLVPALEPVAVITMLVLCARLFTVRLSHREVLTRLAHYAAPYLAGLVVFVLAGLVMPHSWEPTARLGDLVHDALALVLGLEVFTGMPLVLSAASLPAQLVTNLVPPLTTLAFLVVLVRDMAVSPMHVTRDRTRVRELVVRGRGGLFSWMATWPAAIHWFGPGRQSAVAYRASHGVALTVGEPLSSNQICTAAQFSIFCDGQGLVPCFYSVGPQFARAARERGWHAMRIAEESRLELGQVTFRGRRFQDVRTAMNRARREGISVLWTSLPQCSAQLRHDIALVVEGWQDEQALPPMGFTLGGLPEMDDPAVRCELAVDETGRVHAVASWLPLYADGRVIGWLLDVMRRSGHPGAFHSGMELLIGQAALTFQEEGYTVMSLSGSPLARAERVNEPVEDEVSDTITVVVDQIAGALEPYYGFTSLHHFKSKFGPDYRPLYLVYADPSHLPSIGRALATAYLSDGDRVSWRAVIARLVRARRTAGARGA
ncbi:bifunctional lysylphosphatidylglycerol flippase/synthetase MprF [Propionibacterium australiense]|uniref:DUF2156 domain-containing protein n=1 Tax=Propionibacterium australiense TaxID=119981 RepID=A0A8B3FNG4_9ACTN|nr:DUF2156 domain-containing protein [Propionibacterium australiense]RLP12133.1 DUF2156 domain-containing protein [Propionibacterium australiense]